MTNDNVGTVDEKLLRDTLTRQAPKPSAAHNEAIMAAARANAARTRRNRLIERNRTWSGIGLAAALVLAFGIWQTVPNTGEPDPGTRGADPAAEILPVDNASLAIVPTEFRWPEVHGARRYKMSLYDSAAALLWESDWTEATSLTLPAAASDEIAADNSYFWTVEHEGNGSLRNLGPYWFKIE